jgi:hypothetical protein
LFLSEGARPDVQACHFKAQQPDTLVSYYTRVSGTQIIDSVMGTTTGLASSIGYKIVLCFIANKALSGLLSVMREVDAA